MGSWGLAWGLRGRTTARRHTTGKKAKRRPGRGLPRSHCKKGCILGELPKARRGKFPELKTVREAGRGELHQVNSHKGGHLEEGEGGELVNSEWPLNGQN